MNERNSSGGQEVEIDCAIDPVAGLTKMFVDIVQKSRIDAGQIPALRPVFLKLHGSAKGTLTLNQDAQTILPPGLFPTSALLVWIRFSSDTVPSEHGFKKTLGIGLKLFGIPGETLFGDPEDITLDLIFQNHHVFFLDTSSDMCAFTKAAVVDRNIQEYLDAHPITDQILKDMEKPEPSALSAQYWTILPHTLGPKFAKFILLPELTLDQLADQPDDPDYLARDLEERLASGEARFTLNAEIYQGNGAPPDRMTEPWAEAEHPIYPIGTLRIDQQDVTEPDQAEFGENLSYNIWRVPPALQPYGSIAEARRTVYAAAAHLRRSTNNVPETEPKEL